MSCNKCGTNSLGKLCPFTFGLALGITCGLFMFFWSIWVMYYGMPTSLPAAYAIANPSWSTSGVLGLIGLVKGFVFGLVFAFIYDLILCCCKKCRCCKSSSGEMTTCGKCGCTDKSCTCCTPKV